MPSLCSHRLYLKPARRALALGPGPGTSSSVTRLGFLDVVIVKNPSLEGREPLNVVDMGCVIKGCTRQDAKPREELRNGRSGPGRRPRS